MERREVIVMYENNDYTNGNSPYADGRQQNFSQSGGMQGSVQETQVMPEAPAQDLRGKKERRSRAGFRKVLASVSLGLCFGLSAGVGVWAVAEGTGLFDKRQPAVTESGDGTYEIPEEIQNALKEIDELRELLKETETNVNTVSAGALTKVNFDVSEVAANAMPSMVSIANNYVEKITYFGQPMEREGEASGSGIIVGENETELLIATNYHVIEDAKKLMVHFIDNTDVEAVVKGTDEDMDLAIIAVSIASLSEETRNAISIAKMGDSTSLKLGEPVVAIGNALGYGQSVTNGIVSALDRDVEMEDGSTGTFIQTNAAINPGNSGGALLNIKGEVVGINSSKIGDTLVEGMGYAIPISAAKPILEDLMTKETRNKVSEAGYLGIVPRTVTSDVAELYGSPKGVIVSSVEEGTPAAEGGMLLGDIIVRLGGEKLLTAEELREALEYYAPGETVEIVVMRNINGEYVEVTLQVTLGSRPAAE